MKPSQITPYTFTPEQIDVLAAHVRLALSVVNKEEYISIEEVDAARSALRRIVEQAKACA